MRGIPGSGKSTWRTKQPQLLRTKYVVCSADDYHYIDGVYRFDPLKAGEAHSQCLRKFLSCATSPECPIETLFVDNTNLTAWEISSYYSAALAYGHEVEIVRVHCDFKTAARRQLHAVPLDKLAYMHSVLITERLPPHWKERIVLPEVTHP